MGKKGAGKKSKSASRGDKRADGLTVPGVCMSSPAWLLYLYALLLGWQYTTGPCPVTIAITVLQSQSLCSRARADVALRALCGSERLERKPQLKFHFTFPACFLIMNNHCCRALRGLAWAALACSADPDCRDWGFPACRVGQGAARAVPVPKGN